MAEEKKKNLGGKKESPNTRNASKVNRESFSTWEGHTLTSNEEKFISKYIETGNGRKSVIEAYPNHNPKTAAQKAQQLLNKAYINSEINYRLQEIKDEGIAKAEEVLMYFTSVMRGEIKDQFGIEASLSERTKAAQELAKRQIDIAQKLQGNQEAPEVVIKLDWTRNTPPTSEPTVTVETPNNED